ncbi:MAG: penicillin-binding protein 2 [Pseudohongiellaceae bacterium]
MFSKWQLKDHEAERRLFRRRLVILAGLVLFAFVLLVVKLVNLQVYQHEYFSARADGNRLHSQHVSPPRGLIFDRAGRLLADNQPIHNLTLVRERVPDLDASLKFLVNLIDLSEEEIEQFNTRLSRDRVPHSSVPLKFVLSEEERSRIAANSHRLPGFSIEAQFVRHYPMGTLMAHTVGYVSEINREELENMSEQELDNYRGSNHIGKTGVERTYEKLLHGTVGQETVEKNNLGQVMRQLDRIDPRSGRNLTLHLNSQLQMAAERALGEHRGAVVAIEPATGGILAMVSKPGFDPNLFVTGISNAEYGKLVNDNINTPLFDRSTNPFPPGSTIKPFLALGGLHLELVDYESTINDPGYFTLPGVEHRWHDWTFRSEGGGGHGVTNLRRAIYQSCDTFFYDLGNRMGIDLMNEFLSHFGFGQNFALDMGYARTGVLPSRDWKEEAHGEPWYPGDTINASIGQGYTWVTPLQLATAMAIVANKGRVVQPRLLMAVDGTPYAPYGSSPALSPPSAASYSFPPPSLPEHQLPEDIVLRDADYWDYIEQAMTDVVHRPFTRNFRDYGGAYPYTAMLDEDMPYKMAGKTGTAQVVGISQNINDSDDIQITDLHEDHALFIGYAPVENPQMKPQIALAVFVENGGGGATVASPIAKEIIDTYLLEILATNFAALEDGSDSALSNR